ncbi:uncharacterized protein LOC116620339 [Nematostella vectensis]|uniref:uncharacterized protein LOC116620339 n=1 Tax=Nematostella vectensis TaxID=45351 RepID=UPI0020775369|nr:uncharacterized protein LOC116620339 [Nematostella vectensis]
MLSFYTFHDSQEKMSKKASNNADNLMQVWVIKRHLEKFANPFQRRSLSHSGLLLRTHKGDEFVLEYMADGKAHLYKAEYGLEKEKVKGVTDYIRMRDEMGMEWRWVMSCEGAFVPNDVKVTAEQAKRKLQELMGRDYEEVREKPHCAQEAIRRFLGLEIKNDYTAEGYDQSDESDEEDGS